ncbi:hypothetical protein [Nocardia mangyaensis]|uniref:hypothetical protein n=1 Tax=Nocardia mangyaensis TaxID=2213200 RepID=UPI0026760C5E|nr:hypothetical protein [Nocardia mangyaensis]MDO3646358.1 hypothetical protein [Nocardia mangyaensis]
MPWSRGSSWSESGGDTDAGRSSTYALSTLDQLTVVAAVIEFLTTTPDRAQR